METAVNKLETMFQKAESDLDYIQHKLEFEIMKNLPEDPAAEENPVTLLEELSVVKSHYKMLCVQLDKISREQRESMNCIRAALENTMKMVQALQQHTPLELLPLSEEEQSSAQQLTCQIVKETDSPVEEPTCAVSTVSNPNEESQFKPLTEEMLMAIPRSIRSTVKLADLNSFYRELYNHFVVHKNRAALSVAQMNKMNMKATDSRVKILKELSVVEIDKQGNARLIV
ncbi:PREDICTED: spindle and kinetochore-associated protein 2 isoform X1 [Crocodylus porosus]|uniref:spindle and kinetochore-associated protein 2 isoform X1 n=2 Tax=Crocodylus porosus TaxID=8502 RepID=UPI000939880C|nr:PREDICTED: spindle and kinetochore-associated protein 2 isoform X1 [Crocodylus porosus]